MQNFPEQAVRSRASLSRASSSRCAGNERLAGDARRSIRSRRARRVSSRPANAGISCLPKQCRTMVWIAGAPMVEFRYFNRAWNEFTRDDGIRAFAQRRLGVCSDSPRRPDRPRCTRGRISVSQRRNPLELQHRLYPCVPLTACTVGISTRAVFRRPTSERQRWWNGSAHVPISMTIPNRQRDARDPRHDGQHRCDSQPMTASSTMQTRAGAPIHGDARTGSGLGIRMARVRPCRRLRCRRIRRAWRNASARRATARIGYETAHPPARDGEYRWFLVAARPCCRKRARACRGAGSTPRRISTISKRMQSALASK